MQVRCTKVTNPFTAAHSGMPVEFSVTYHPPFATPLPMMCLIFSLDDDDVCLISSQIIPSRRFPAALH